MKTLPLLALAVLSGLMLCGFKERDVSPSPPSVAQLCVRHDPVNASLIAAELTSVYANCQTHYTCQPGWRLGYFNTRSIDGYVNQNQWLWSGPSTASLNVATQDSLIQSGISAANSLTPLGKHLTNIQFFKDSVFGPTWTYYYLGEIVTYGECLKAVPMPDPFAPQN